MLSLCFTDQDQATGGEDVPAFEFLEFAVEVVAPAPTPCDPSLAPIEVLIQHQGDYQAKQEYVKVIMESVATMSSALNRCISQNEYQLIAFKVNYRAPYFMSNYLFKAIRKHLMEYLRCTEQRLKSIELLVRAQGSETHSISGQQQKILSHVRENVRSLQVLTFLKLKSVEIPAQLRPNTTTKTLLELVYLPPDSDNKLLRDFELLEKKTAEHLHIVEELDGQLNKVRRRNTSCACLFLTFLFS